MKIRRSLSAFLIVALAFSMLAGCGNANEKSSGPSYNMVPGQTISPDTKWIASSVIGAVDESVNVDLKDDFYTAVNKDKFIEASKNVPADADVERYCVGTLNDCEDLTVDAVTQLLMNTDEYLADGSYPNKTEVPDELLRHYYEITGKAYKYIRNWDERNKAGVSPILPYLENIDKISSMAELTDYLLDKDGMNPFIRNLISYGIGVTETLHEDYYCVIDPMNTDGFSLGDPKFYQQMNADAIISRSDNEKLIYSITDKAGIDRAVINDKLKGCYHVEERLAELYAKEVDDPEEANKFYSYQEILELFGDFPVDKMLEKYEYNTSDHFVISNKAYLNRIASVYTSSNLEYLKDYFYIHTILDSAKYLDRESYELADSTSRRKAELIKSKGADEDAPDPDGDNPEDNTVNNQAASKDPDNKIAYDQLCSFIGGPVNYIYAASVCTPEDKEYLIELTENIIASHREMILSEDWMSDEVKAKTIEKLDAIGINILYPDEYIAYDGLSLEAADSIIEIINLCKEDQYRRLTQNINKPFDRTAWNIEEISTLASNAFYVPSRNSIFILAGICISDEVFNINRGKEANFGSIGTVVGHEITHAFDTNGSKYTWDGYEKKWWSNADRQVFDKRAEKLISYYSSIAPLNGVTRYSGNFVKDEAIADLGGMKSILIYASKDPNWDYDAFFRSYENIWFQVEYYDFARYLVKQDSHPLSYFRGNVVVMQFDEFKECYGIKEGDGMYISDENKILVW